VRTGKNLLSDAVLRVPPRADPAPPSWQVAPLAPWKVPH